MYFSDHATEYQEVRSPAITVCSVSSENPYFSVFHKLNSKCSLHRKSIFLYVDDSFHIAYVPQQWLQIPDLEVEEHVYWKMSLAEVLS